jgi:RHS repeat-associated protein
MTDIVTDLQWNINRWYDAKVGRWISEDPIGFVGNDLNLYRISKNSSLILFDPTGLVSCPGGDWTFWGTTSGGQVIIGYTSSIVTFRCNQANIVRKKLYKCCTQTIEKNVIDIAFADGNIYTILFGAGLGGHVRRTYGSAHNANQASELAGWSYPSIGFSIDVVLAGGGVSGGCGGGSADIGAGIGVGISVSAQESYISITCNWTQRYVRKLSVTENSTIISDGPCQESFQSVIPNEPTTYDLSLYDTMN